MKFIDIMKTSYHNSTHMFLIEANINIIFAWINHERR